MSQCQGATAGHATGRWYGVAEVRGLPGRRGLEEAMEGEQRERGVVGKKGGLCHWLGGGWVGRHLGTHSSHTHTRACSTGFPALQPRIAGSFVGDRAMRHQGAALPLHRLGRRSTPLAVTAAAWAPSHRTQGLQLPPAPYRLLGLAPLLSREPRAFPGALGWRCHRALLHSAFPKSACPTEDQPAEPSA